MKRGIVLGIIVVLGCLRAPNSKVQNSGRVPQLPLPPLPVDKADEAGHS